MSYADIKNYEDYLREICPELRFYDAPQGLEVYYHMQVSTIERQAVNDLHAKSLVRALAEQVRHRAIQDLGLKPILAGYEREIRDYRTRAQAAEDQARALSKQVAQLERENDKLREEL